MAPFQARPSVFSPGGWGKGLAEYEAWLGRRVAYVVDNADQNQVMLSKNFLWHVGALADASAATPAHLVLGVPMLTKDTAGQFAEGLAGKFDAVYRQHALGLAKHLRRTIAGVEYRLIVRLAWELNGAWMPWFAGKNVEGFKALWRRIVGIYRAVDPRFEFSFCTTLGRQGMSDAALAWPGDDVADYVDLDVYFEDFRPAAKRSADTLFEQDYLTAPNGLLAWRVFAALHGKPLAYSEIGAGKVNAGVPTLPDDGRPFELFAAWLQAHPPAWCAYFERENFRIADGSKPLAAAAYKRLFAPPRVSIEIDGRTVAGDLIAP